MRLFVIARHAHSRLNQERRVNGDPSVHVPLTDQGIGESRRLGLAVSGISLDLCVHTRFDRTRQTAEVALAARDVSLTCEPLLDDVDVGELEGRTIDDYRAWKRGRTRKDRFPGGESLDEAAARYAEGYRRLLARPAQAVLVVCHEIPLRYALNAVGGSTEFDGPVRELPNATPFLFDEEALRLAAERIGELART